MHACRSVHVYVRYFKCTQTHKKKSLSLSLSLPPSLPPSRSLSRSLSLFDSPNCIHICKRTYDIYACMMVYACTLFPKPFLSPSLFFSLSLPLSILLSLLLSPFLSRSVAGSCLWFPATCFMFAYSASHKYVPREGGGGDGRELFCEMLTRTYVY